MTDCKHVLPWQRQAGFVLCLKRSLKFQSLKPANHGTTDPIGGKFSLGPGFRIGFQAYCSLVWPPFPWLFLVIPFQLGKKKEGRKRRDGFTKLYYCVCKCVYVHAHLCEHSLVSFIIVCTMCVCMCVYLCEHSSVSFNIVCAMCVYPCAHSSAALSLCVQWCVCMCVHLRVHHSVSFIIVCAMYIVCMCVRLCAHFSLYTLALHTSSTVCSPICLVCFIALLITNCLST